MSAIRHELIRYSPTMWRSLETPWRRIYQASQESSPFLSAPWIATWVEVFGPLMRPEGHLWFDGVGTPIGCALLSVRTERLGPLPIRRAYVNATGEWRVGSEHNDVLGSPERRAEILEELVREVLSNRIDELYLVGFRAEALETIKSVWPTSIVAGHESEDPYVALADLRSTGREYLGALSSNSRSAIRRSMRLYLEAFGEPTFEVAPSAELASRWFDELRALHASRWAERGEQGAFGNADSLRFHTRLIEVCRGGDPDPSGVQVDIARVRFGEETIGVLYNLRCHGRVCFYQSGLRYHEDKRLKPGLVTHALAVENYLAAGETEYDFLGGEPQSVQYKRSLATSSRSLAWIRLGAPTLRARLLSGVRALRGHMGRSGAAPDSDAQT